MNTKTKKKLKTNLNSIVEGLISRLEKIENFTLEQTPDICKELVARKVVQLQNEATSGALGIVLSTLGYYVSFVLCNMSYTVCDADSYCRSETNDLYVAIAFVIALVSSVCILPSFFVMVNSLLELRELKAAPKLIVLEELRQLIKN